jgi:Na+/H+ antiporter NhaD/arsenite permease-like protein
LTPVSAGGYLFHGKAGNVLVPNPKLVTILIFLATYALIIFFYHHKIFVVWGAAALLVVLGLLTPLQGLGAIDWNVILLYFGMLLVSEVFLFSKMPDHLATLMAARAGNVGIAMVLICVFTGLLSTAIENVAVVLLVAPIALSISKKCGINPVPLFIGMSISSNLQGAATLIGDPPSMLLAGFAKMNFNDFFVIGGKPSIFFAVQVGAAVSTLVLFFIFKKYHKPMPALQKERYASVVPSVLVFLLVVSLIVSSSFTHPVSYLTGLLCCVFGVICFLWYLLSTKGKELSKFAANLDWQTGVFLMGIFVLVRSLSAQGLMEDAARLILRASGGSPFVVYLMIVWISVFLSAFIDNVPFLVAMLPVVRIITGELGIVPYVMYFGLLLGASIGGNITPIGASANIVAMGILKKQGYHVRFMEFVRIGFPFTIAAVIASSIFVWFVVMP